MVKRARVPLLSMEFNKLHATHAKPRIRIAGILSWTVEISGRIVINAKTK